MIRPLLAAIAALLPVSVPAQDLTPRETARIDGIVAGALAATGTPSATIAIVRGGRLVYAHGWGKASETRAAAADMPYQIGSISKQFTAAALLLLQRDGKLRLDDPVARYLPGITGGDTITVRQLLSHTAGLQDYWPQDYRFPAMARPITPDGIVDRWARKPLDFAPGTRWQYSNTGYVVAGLIVEKVAGEPLLPFLRRRVFAPLGIAAGDADLAVDPAFPQGYDRYALGPVRVATPTARGWIFAAGELSMSAPDLARWDIARLDRALLDPADWRAQETEVTLANGKGSGYGLGVEIGALDGHRFIEHSGGVIGFSTENYVFPNDRAAVVVFTNAGFGNAYATIARAVARLILPSAAPDAAMGSDDAATARARRLFEQLREGRPDRAILTADASAYFTTTAIADYRASLSGLPAPTGFALARPPLLRGGFVNRVFKATYPDRTLTISTYAEPGERGRYEQFLIMPSG